MTWLTAFLVAVLFVAEPSYAQQRPSQQLAPGTNAPDASRADRFRSVRFQWRPTNIDFATLVSRGGEIRGVVEDRALVQLGRTVYSCPAGPVAGVQFGDDPAALLIYCAELQPWADRQTTFAPR